MSHNGRAESQGLTILQVFFSSAVSQSLFSSVSYFCFRLHFRMFRSAQGSQTEAASLMLENSWTPVLRMFDLSSRDYTTQLEQRHLHHHSLVTERTAPFGDLSALLLALDI